jgi:hypothetical protein
MAETYSLRVTPSCASATNGAGALNCVCEYTLTSGGGAGTPEGATELHLLDAQGNTLRLGNAGRGVTTDFVGLPDASYQVEWRETDTGTVLATGGNTLSCAGNPNPGGGGGGSTPTGPTGCTTERALNYDPTATQDATPTLCVFVEVTTPLSGLVAAHLPIPVVLRASPTVDGLASVVVLYLETASTPSGPWVQFGRLRQVCDEMATVRFDLSEAAKSLLRILPPVESGLDRNLSALLRARYEVLDPVTLTAIYSGDVGACRALNAVVQSSSGATLTTPTPYADIPDGSALWRSVATYAGGVSSTPLALPGNSCQARQFVWLNAKGAWDSGFFFGRHIHGTDQADPIQFRDLAGADRYAKRGTVRPTLQVYSDKLDWATFRAIRGVRDSIQVWERLGPDEYAPVLVNTESYQEYQEVTDKTYQVNFTVSYAPQLIQTQ